MKTIRVAMLAPPWLPIPPKGYGGIENVIAALVPALQNIGVEVELFSTGDSTIDVKKNHWLYDKGQFDFIHRPMYDAMPIAIAHILYSLNKVRELGNFDIIHDHNGFVGSLTLSFEKFDLPPAIHTLHGPPFSNTDRLTSGIPDNIPMWQQYKAAKDLYFVPISKALSDDAPRELKKHMLSVVHNAVDLNEFPYVDKKQDYFITLGRFHPEKGQHIAVSLAIDMGFDLKMAGRVGDLDDPKKLLLEIANPLSIYRGLPDFRYYSDKIFPFLLESNVENVGEVSGNKKMQFISNAKALLFPIQWEEPFGMAAIEALACGTPVISMARGALPEIIVHGVNGFLAKNKNDFKKYIKRIGEIDPKNCRASVRKNFSAEKMAKEYLKRYQKVIAHKS